MQGRTALQTQYFVSIYIKFLLTGEALMNKRKRIGKGKRKKSKIHKEIERLVSPPLDPSLSGSPHSA
jgi:hypothetical protein